MKVFRGTLKKCGQVRNAHTPRILVTGALGQIGTELCRQLRTEYGAENVIASDVKLPQKAFSESGPFIYADVTNYHTLAQAAVEHSIDWVVHNSSMVSVAGEANPSLAMDINIQGARNVMNLCKDMNLRVLAPSTMGVFSPESGKHPKEDVVLKPTTIYGVCKIFLEQLGNYYNRKYGVDFRCLRYPGIISHETLPGGGTTDYGIEMIWAALQKGQYVCPLHPDEALPMMYMSDCLDATCQMLAAPEELLKQRVYNVAAMSFTPKELAAEIEKHVPGFTVEYKVDRKFQDIAETWPNTLDDSAARQDWGWKNKVDTAGLVEDMLDKVSARLEREQADLSSTRKDTPYRTFTT